jgi:type IV pilus assembly protein PilQ
MVLASVLLLAVLIPVAEGPETSPGEATVSLDVKDAPVTDIVQVLADVAGFQVIFDPGPVCRLTLRLHSVRWPTALDSTLRACGLSQEESGGVVRIAPAGRLIEEAAAETRLREARSAARTKTLATFRLSYARAREMAPIVKELLGPGGEVVFDERTNTLLVHD